MKLAIIVGHSAKAPGMVASEPISMSEYAFNTVIAEKMLGEASAHGIQGRIFTRDSMTIPELGKAVNDWSRGDQAVALELHLNSSQGGASRGCETLYDSLPPENKRLAQIMQATACNVLGHRYLRDRGAKPHFGSDRTYPPVPRGHYVIRVLEIPACVIEPIFADNRMDANLLNLRKDDYARALVEAVHYFYKHH